MIEQEKAWAIVELMGHRRLAGEVSQSTLFGVPLLRIDIPAVGEIPANTQMYGASAVYCVSIVEEPVARAAAQALQASPIAAFGMDLIPMSEHRDLLHRALSRYQLTDRDAEEDDEDDRDSGF